MMSLDEIKKALKDGLDVFWKSSLYVVILDNIGRYLVVCTHNDYTTPLTPSDYPDCFSVRS